MARRILDADQSAAGSGGEESTAATTTDATSVPVHSETDDGDGSETPAAETPFPSLGALAGTGLLGVGAVARLRRRLRDDER